MRRHAARLPGDLGVAAAVTGAGAGLAVDAIVLRLICRRLRRGPLAASPPHDELCAPVWIIS